MRHGVLFLRFCSGLCVKPYRQRITGNNRESQGITGKQGITGVSTEICVA